MIDGCTKTFSVLANDALPDYMDRMRNAVLQPHALNEFCLPGVGVKTILKKLRRTDDFSGCYVLLRKGKAFYVGISRVVVSRLRQHGKGSSHFDASLAYKMARAKIPHNLTRSEAMKDPAFLKAFGEAQQLLRDSDVASIDIPNPLDCLFEAYCAMELDTKEWNTFRTH